MKALAGISPRRKVKARTVVGRGKKRLLSGPGCELRLGREKEKGIVRSNGRDERKIYTWYLVRGNGGPNNNSRVNMDRNRPWVNGLVGPGSIGVSHRSISPKKEYMCRNALPEYHAACNDEYRPHN